jgi:hypothetical protein
MSEPNSPLNPYAAPVPGYAPHSMEPRAGERPGWYTAYCVIAIVLGGLGLSAGLFGLASLMVNRLLRGGMAVAPAGQGMPEELAGPAAEFQGELHALESHYLYYLLIGQVIAVFVAIGLVVGGVLSLGMKRSGARVLANAFVAASVFDVIRLVFAVFYQMEVAQATRKFMSQLMEEAAKSNGPESPDMAPFMGTVMSVSLGATVCFGVGWVLVKLVLYLSGWVYLNKPETQALLKD